MKTEIIDKKENALLKRQEVLVKVDHEGKATPTRKELLSEMAKNLKAKEDLIIIDKIFSFK